MILLIRFSLILAFLIGALQAGVLSYEEIKNEPKSLAKDYYIYRLIDETEYEKKEIQELKKDIFRNKGKLKTLIDKIFPPQKRADNCKGVGSKNILEANLTCKKARMYPNFIKYIKPQVRTELAKEFKNSLDYANLLNGYNTSNPASYFAQTGNVKNFYLYYKSLNETERKLKFNISLNSSFVENLAKNWQFKGLISDAVIGRKFDNLRKSLLDMNTTQVSQETAFLLGINSVMFEEDEKSIKFFAKAASSYKKQSDKDNANFWIYLINKDESLLKNIANSSDYNIYSLYAKEKLGLKDINIVIPNPKKSILKDYNITNPFVWVKTKELVKRMNKEKLLEYAKRFDTKSTVGEYSYMMNIATGYKDRYYPMPFMEFIADKDNHRKALILAIARQESRFIPSAISTSYALGMMQFMPFLANDIGKNKFKIKNFDQDDMFNPQIAYKFANYHLDWMEQNLTSPVFLAYAYNGGMGFTRRMLTRGDLFNEGRFEPFLSLELVPYEESRIYAKKVLSNYIIYRQILEPKAKVSIIDILKNLTIPSKSDNFR